MSRVGLFEAHVFIVLPICEGDAADLQPMGCALFVGSIVVRIDL